MSAEHPVEAQYANAARQYEAVKLSVWVFLATEVMFFAALFAAYFLYRYDFPSAFRAGSQHLDGLLGTLDTADLITSSLFMAIAVQSARRGARGPCMVFLGLTLLLGLGFLGIHGHEYLREFHEGALPGRFYHLGGVEKPGASIFFTCYFFMTGLHSIHVAIGVGLITWMLVRTARREFSTGYSSPVEAVGLYWHFVDMVWVFLYPMFYLVA